MKTKITALFLTVILLLSIFVGCTPQTPGNNENNGNQNGTANNDSKCNHRDADDDYVCDYCGELYFDQNDSTGGGNGGSNKCDHRDKNDDGICDYCNRLYEDGSDCTHRDKDDNGICDYCGCTHYDGNDVTDDDWYDCTHQDENDDGICDYCKQPHDDGCHHNNYIPYDVYEDDYSEATCTEGVTISYKTYCGNCNAYLYTTQAERSPLGHTTEYGTKVGTCSRCLEIDPGVTIDPNAPYTVVEEGGIKFVFMGEYPQQVKADDVSIVSGPNEKDYYLGSDGCYYVKYVAKPNSHGDNDFENGEKITFGKEYYFKVMPIRWKVVSEEGGKARLVCDFIIDYVTYQQDVKYEGSYAYLDVDGSSEKIPANAYFCSSLRKWLNDQFYNQAFNAAQQQVILTTTVSVNEEVSNYNNKHTPTEDKIFISSKETKKTDVNNSIRITDYLRAKGYGTMQDGRWDFGAFWLRDPLVGWSSFNDKMAYVTKENTIQSMDVSYELGVLPVMYISFE